MPNLILSPLPTTPPLGIGSFLQVFLASKNKFPSDLKYQIQPEFKPPNNKQQNMLAHNTPVIWRL